MGPFGKANDVGQIVVSQGDGVDLDRDPGGNRGVDPGDHAAKVAAAGDPGVSRGVEAIERDVGAADAMRGERHGMIGEVRAVGGQRQLVERARGEVPRQPADEIDEALAHQRLAAGQAQLAHPLPDEPGRQAVELGKFEHFGARQEGHPLGHAISASEVAAVGHRQPQIGDGAAIGVDHANASRKRRPRRTAT